MVVFILNNFEGYRCSDYHIIFGELWRLVDQPMAFSGLCGHEGGRMVQALVQGYKSLVLCFYFPIYPSRPALRLWRGLRCDPGNDLYRGGERQAEWTLQSPHYRLGPTFVYSIQEKIIQELDELQEEGFLQVRPKVV